MVESILIVTTVSSWPEALEIQKKAIDKFCRNKTKFIAVIDTSPKPNPWNLWDTKLRNKAIEFAGKFCDELVEFPEELHINRKAIFPNTRKKISKYSNERASDVLQYIYNLRIQNHQGPVMILDSDMFPFAEFDIYEDLSNKMIRGVWQHRKGRLGKEVNYYWNGLLEMNPAIMLEKSNFSFDCGKVCGIPVDTGGQSHYWLKQMKEFNLEEKLGTISHLSSLNWSVSDYKKSIPNALLEFIVNDDRNQSEKIYSEIYDDKFLHFRSGSNWRNEEPYKVTLRQSSFLASFKNCI